MQKVKKAPKAGGRIARVGTLPMLYVVFWSFAGAASAAYLSLVITDPELVSSLSSRVSAPEAPPAEVVASPQARALRNRLSEAQKDIAQLRTELSEHKEAYETADVSEPDPADSEELNTAAAASDEQLASDEVPAAARADVASEDRVASADHEEAAGPDAAPTASSPVPGVFVPGVSIASPPMAPAVVSTATPDTPALSAISEVAIANTTADSAPVEPSNIETGALAVPPTPSPGLRPKPKPEPVVAVAKTRPPAARAVAPANAAAPAPEVVAFGPATVMPGPAPAAQPQAMGVRLASAPSLDALRLTWNAMRERHGEALRGLKPRYVKQDPGNSAAGPYTLVAGPVAKPTDVLEICAGLGGESLECALTDFEGRTL